MLQYNIFVGPIILLLLRAGRPTDSFGLCCCSFFRGSKFKYKINISCKSLHSTICTNGKVRNA